MTIGAALTLGLTPITWALQLFTRILTSANALAVYVAFFFIYTVLRLFIRPLLGEAHRARESRSPRSTSQNNAS